jgi:arylsulfatase
VVFAEQRAEGFDVWQEPFVFLRLPKLFNLRTDPFEQADHVSINYPQWRAERLFALVPAQAFVGKFLGTFKDYPPRQKPGSFSIDQVLDTLQTGSARQ